MQVVGGCLDVIIQAATREASLCWPGLQSDGPQSPPRTLNSFLRTAVSQGFQCAIVLCAASADTIQAECEDGRSTHTIIRKKSVTPVCPSECLAVSGSSLYKASFFHNGKFQKENNEEKRGKKVHLL